MRFFSVLIKVGAISPTFLFCKNMPSPFESFANAKLSFQVPSAEMEFDNYGNPVPKTTLVLVRAVLKLSQNTRFQRTQEGSPNAISGAAQLMETWKGYLVEPLLMPSVIKPGMLANAEIATGLQILNLGIPEPLIEKGEFQLLPTPQSPYLINAGIQEVTPISGTFTRIN